MSLKTIYVYANPKGELGLILDMPQEPNILDYIKAKTTDWVLAIRKYNKSLEAVKGNAIPIKNRDFVCKLIHEETRTINPDTFTAVSCIDYQVMEVRDLQEEGDNWSGGYKKIAVISEEENRKKQKVSIGRGRAR